MARTNRDVERKLLAIQLTVDRIQANVEIKSGLETYNITGAKVDEGVNLYQTARGKYESRVSALANQVSATQTVNRLWAAAHKTYMNYVDISRKKLTDDIAALELLDLNGERKSTIAEWLPQSRRFYNNALGTEAIKTQLATVGITEERLQAGLAAVNAVEAAYNQQQEKIALSQQARVDRDKSLSAALQWRREVLAVARVALQDKPELMEVLSR